MTKSTWMLMAALAAAVVVAVCAGCGEKKPDSAPGALKQDVTMAESAKAATEHAAAPAESVATAGAIYYTCEMHPEVRSDKPGQCPKCGMDLIAKNDKAAKAAGAAK